jgi:hypothetical protein
MEDIEDTEDVEDMEAEGGCRGEDGCERTTPMNAKKKISPANQDKDEGDV